MPELSLSSLFLQKGEKNIERAIFLCVLFSSYFFFIFSGYLVLWTLASAGRESKEPTTTTNYNVCVHVCSLVYVYLPVLLDAQKHKHISFFFFTFHTVFWSTAQNTQTHENLSQITKNSSFSSLVYLTLIFSRFKID